MNRQSSLKAQLNTATTLISEGRLTEAEDALRIIADDPGVAALGPRTALGIPRRLHSAWLKLAKAKGDQRNKVALQYHLVPPPDVLAPLFQPNAEDRRASIAAAAMPVPRILHQIWIGSPPPETTDVWRSYASQHGWHYELWDEDALSALSVVDNQVYRHMRDAGDLPGAVDVARYMVLRDQGGLYLDCDWLPVRDEGPDTAIPMTGLSAIAEETPRLTGLGSPFLNNSVIAAPPAHPVFKRLLRSLPAVIERLPRGPAWWVTGPLVFTLASRAGPVTVLDAGFSAGRFSGTRDEVDRHISELREQQGSEFLCGWKPWDVS